jgi:3-oxoacyl-[acyl-carrier protein] reductase
MELQNKKALITGASQGIGRSALELFLKEGAEVWGLDIRKPTDLETLMSSSNGKLHWVDCDLGNLPSVEDVIKEAIKSSGGFDILLINAGITKDNLAFRMTIEDFQKVININLTAAFLVARTIARDMTNKKSGSIVNTASVVGIHGNGGQANYSASKAGLIAVTKTLALEVASRGIRVNAVAPGFITSAMTDAMTDQAREKMLEHIPLRRAGTIEDVANAMLFLASDRSTYITGQVIPVDGGMFT